MRPDTPISTKRDLIGGPVYWGGVLATLACLVACFFVRSGRMWIGLGVLLMWTAFSLANAVRSRRVHSIMSAPVYLVAAVALAGVATGRIDVEVWMIWVIGAGMIAANLSERVVGKYL
jgi:hypothetical protein